MQSRLSVILVIVLITLAGCGGSATTPSPTQSSTTTPVATDTPAETETPTPTTTSTPTPVPTATPEPLDPDNPFSFDELRVSINTSASDRDLRPSIVEALKYWENNSERYVGYPIEFEIVNESEHPHIEIGLSEPPINCGFGGHDRTVGCAPINEESATTPNNVQIATNQSKRGTYEIAVHEIGHVLGLTHSDRPVYYMQSQLPSAVHRDTVHVYVGHQDRELNFDDERAVENAMEYYESHDELNESQQLNWKWTDSKENADLIVQYRTGDNYCSDDSDASCAERGPYSDQVTVILDGITSEQAGWHIAYQLSVFFFDEDEIPEELSPDVDYDTATGEWRD